MILNAVNSKPPNPKPPNPKPLNSKSLNSKSRSQKPAKAKLMKLALASALLLMQGCRASWVQKRFPAVTAQMEVIKLNAPGRYQVSGTTGLSENTKMGVAAVRYLTLTKPVSSNPAGRRVYALLDYEVTEVDDGIWQTDLDLWEAGPSGDFQEGWQGYGDRLGWSVVPDEEIVFLTIPTPTKDLAELEQRLRNRQYRLDDALLRQTFEGERYAEVTYVDAIPLPVGGTAITQQRPHDINGGWGRRYLLQPESPNPNTLERPSDRLTTAPPTPEEFLR